MAELLLQQYLAKIGDLLQGDRCDEALAHCRHLLRFFPWHGQTHVLLGRVYLESEDLPQAVKCFHRALSVDPENLDAWEGLGRAHDEQGRFLEAAWALQRALELAPGDAGLWAHLQHLCTQIGGWSGDQPEITHGALARFYLRNGLLEQAIAQFGIACQRGPNWPGPQAALAEALWQAERYPEALETSLDLLRLAPHCLKANLVAGAIRMQSGQSDAAEVRFQIAQALDPENRMAQQVLGPNPWLPAVEIRIPEPETESTPPQAEQEAQGRWPAESAAAEPEGQPAWGSIERASSELPGKPAPEPAQASEVPANLRALVDAGILDKVDLQVGLAELAEIRAGAGQPEQLSDQAVDLSSEEELAVLIRELILPSTADGAS